MSKAFTKDEAPEAPLLVRRRAPLPDGVPNWVTRRGLELLRGERAALDGERVRLAAADPDDPERARRLAVAGARLADLDARIASARVVDPTDQPPDDVRFGATVTLRVTTDCGGEERRLTIVGVDEADPARGRVAFVAPIARAILGLRAGEVATLRTGRGDEELEVLAIAYEG